MPRAARGIKTADKRPPAHSAGKDKLVRGAPVVWWLTADFEVCAVCGEGYACGTEYRCAGCDAAVCMFCVVDRSGEFRCTEC